MSNRRRAIGRLPALGLVLGLACVAGCGGVKTHPVRGKVVLEGGDVKKLAGANVEFQLDSDPSVRSYGEIKEDGSFEMTTLHAGRTVSGVPEGAHTARILISGDLEEEDEPVPRDADEAPEWQPKSKQKKKDSLPVNARFLRFKTSGLKYQVPTSGEITVKVSVK